jgi:hypothetical protein
LDNLDNGSLAVAFVYDHDPPRSHLVDDWRIVGLRVHVWSSPLSACEKERWC